MSLDRPIRQLILCFVAVVLFETGELTADICMSRVTIADPTTTSPWLNYRLIGGFLAVSRTDVFQAMLMVVSLVIIVVTLTNSTESPFSGIGGSSASFLSPFTNDDGSPLTAVFLLSIAGWAFGAFAAQRILQRFMALERKDLVPQSCDISIVCLLAVYGLAVMLGLLTWCALSEANLLTGVTDAERIYFVVSEAFFHPAVMGLLLTAVIAAVMSAADSQLLLASAVACDDFPFVNRVARGIAARARIWLGRLLLIVVGAVAISLFYPESVFDLSVTHGENGCHIWPGDDLGSILAQVQPLGCHGVHPGGDVDGLRVGVPRRRSRQYLGRSAGHAGLPHRHVRGCCCLPPHTKATEGNRRPLRQSELPMSRRPSHRALG